MKKAFQKLAIFVATSNLTLPLTACVYNFYVDSAKNAIIKSFADQTSSVVKSLILAKEKNTDTSQTIQDILAEFSNPSINNKTSNTNLNTWQEFSEKWGLNKNIVTKNFNPEEYFIATGKGSLTQQVNTYKTMNSIFSSIGLISSLNIADNRLVYSLIKGDGEIKSSIVRFLAGMKKETPEEFPDDLRSAMVIVKNIIVGNDWKNPDANNAKKTIINPVTSLLNNLVKGLWTSEQTTPADSAALKTFMDSWKDEDGKPYSQWNSGSSWDLATKYYQNWNKTDFNFYRSGVLINHLFYQIGKDYQIKKPGSSEYQDRYLGDVISDSALGDLMGDLGQYTAHLSENPKYIITLIEAIVPVIKQWALKMSDISQGAKNLTFGKFYPTDDTKNSYNFSDIITNLQTIINNPDGDPSKPNLKYIIESILGLNDNVTGYSFAYDIKFNLGGKPLPDYSGFIGALVKSKVQDLVNDTLLPAINSLDLKGIFTNVENIYNEWIKQYDEKNQGVNFDLEKLQEFLLNSDTGLLTALNRDVVPVLYNIITNPNQPVDDEKYFEFYRSLGGVTPPDPNSLPSIAFRPNSVLDLLKKNINDFDSPLGQLVLILIGNSSTNNVGLFNFITNSNLKWLKDNYTRFFDITNKSLSRVYNQIMTTVKQGDQISNILTYNFSYKINNKTYYFLIKCKSIDTIENTGTKNFYFSEINLEAIK